jgi:chromosome segregation ATPase
MNNVRTILPALTLGGLILAAGCSLTDAGSKNDIISDEVWLQELRDRDSALGELMNTVTMIETSLEEIKLREGLLELPASGEFPASRREKILKDIQLITLLLDDSRKKLAEVEEKLKNNGIASDALRHQISELNTILATRTRTVDSVCTTLKLKEAEIAMMSLQIRELGNTVEAHEEVIVKQEKTINEAFYAIGTKRDLKKNGVLKDGVSLPGTGSRMNEKLNEESFVRIDIRQVTSIPVMSKRAKLLSYHTDGSFEWKKVKNEVASLEIKDPEKFWKTSKYLIIELH